MEFVLKAGVKPPEKGVIIALSSDKGGGFNELSLQAPEKASIEESLKKGVNPVSIICGKRMILTFPLPGNTEGAEAVRKKGAEAAGHILGLKTGEVYVSASSIPEESLLLFLEGMLLASYTFTKYKKEKRAKALKVSFSAGTDKKRVAELENLVRAVFKARDLVNEPASYLTSEVLGSEIKDMAREAGFTAEVLGKKKIESLKLGGLLAVNSGSENPPAFIILEYKPSKPVNKKPVVLVGKGVVFDTGGLSLKPAQGMEHMKADMGGAAAVAGLFYAASLNKLPIHLAGLIPATDNRPGQKAISPGDIITTFGGKTVEVLNTDAEGRLILADALEYAARYRPELVIDLATLTGSAFRAIGTEGVVMMGTANPEIKKQLSDAGMHVHERLVEFPLWPEYLGYLESDIADLKNVGPAEAGAITAGKFLEQFTSYPWIHLDIAGMAFLNKTDSYRLKNGTGVGIRLLYRFLKNYKK